MDEDDPLEKYRPQNVADRVNGPSGYGLSRTEAAGIVFINGLSYSAAIYHSTQGNPESLTWLGISAGMTGETIRRILGE